MTLEMMGLFSLAYLLLSLSQRSESLNWFKCSILHNKLSLDVKIYCDGNDSCTTMQMFLMPLNCTLKMVKMVNFMLSIF